jgi:alpha-methylacyl-CoA racemase
MCALGVLLALQERARSGKGQVVDAAMIDGVSYIGSFVYNMQKAGALFQTPRGTGQLDGGAPFYDTYKTKDGKYMAVGAIETEFYRLLIKGLGLDQEKDQLPEQMDTKSWARMKELFTKIFLSKTQEEWVAVFDQTDACVTPILDYYEMPTPAPAPRLLRTPARQPAGSNGGEDGEMFLEVGGQSKEVLMEAGFSEQEIRELVAKNAVAGAGLEKSSL